MLSQQEITELIEKFQSGTISKEEKHLLDEWYHSFDEDDNDIEFVINESRLDFKNRLKQKIQESIDQQPVREIRPLYKRRIWYAAAATVIGVLALSYFLISQNFSKNQQTANSSSQLSELHDVAPGSNKAVLTLADGSTVVLDTAANGVIHQQGDIKVQKLNNGLLSYAANGNSTALNEKTEYNTISTPRGGQYQITLSDGTKVWLNAASSIRFPVAFTGNERRVEITGEAYFEVAKNKLMPFKVKATSAEVEVLGTHFNINAYDDEAFVKTTDRKSVV